jgi:hypothetical protein
MTSATMSRWRTIIDHRGWAVIDSRWWVIIDDRSTRSRVIIVIQKSMSDYGNA